MTKIVFWTSSPVSVVKKIIGPALNRCPRIPGYRFKPVTDVCYVPEADEVVLAMGEDAVKLMAERKLVPKNRKPDGLQGKLYSLGNGEGSYMVSYAPSDTYFDPSLQTEIVWAVQLVARFATTGSLAAVYGDYRWVEHFEDLIQSIETKYAETGKAVPVAFDTETLHLSPFDAGSRIVACGFTDTVGKADLAYVGDIKTEEQAKRFLASVRWLLTSDKVRLRLAHGKFDLSWVAEKWGIETTNFAMDTLLVGSMMDENRSNSLKTHIKHYDVLLGGYDDTMTQWDMEHMDKVPKDKLLNYLGGDVDGTLRVSIAMLEEFAQQPEQMRLYLTIVHPASKLFGKIERNGIQVDQEAYRALDAELITTIHQCGQEALSLLPGRLCSKYADNLSIGRPALLKDYFFSPLGLNLKPKVLTAKSGEPSTAKQHLEMFFDTPEAKAMCDVLDRLNQAKKAKSTYVDGFLAHLKRDGKFHPSYFMHQGDNEWGDDEGGTVTGRKSAKNPAIQTVPKRTIWGKKIRKCLIALPGFTLLEADYSQAELRLAACVAEEPTMLQMYLNNIDLHCVTGADIGGFELEEMMALEATDLKLFEMLRYKAKSRNFGLIYGMSAEGYQTYAWVGYRLKVSLEEATTAREIFFNRFDKLLAWHETYRNLVYKNKEVQNPFGRIRHLPTIDSPDRFTASKAKRQSVNSPIQGGVGDMLDWAMSEVDANYGDMIHPVAQIHDAGYWSVPEDRAYECAVRVTETMENLPFEKLGWVPQIRFPADATMGHNLGQMTKVKIPA
jgi:DNA polymerase I-like protein with 3'-5' exonuclease and polymerase domains